MHDGYPNPEDLETLAPLIPGLGTDTYQRTVETAYPATDSSPF
jgi:hypothetical protein